MAFNAAPSSWLTSWSEDGTNITVPIATFPQLTAAEADASTGDVRKVLFALADGIYSVWNSKASADRPTKMYIAKNSQVDTTTGIVTQTYTMRFYTSIGSEEVVAE